MKNLRLTLDNLLIDFVIHKLNCFSSFYFSFVFWKWLIVRWFLFDCFYSIYASLILIWLWIGATLLIKIPTYSFLTPFRELFLCMFPDLAYPTEWGSYKSFCASCLAYFTLSCPLRLVSLLSLYLDSHNYMIPLLRLRC